MAKKDTPMTTQDFERFNETDFGVIFEKGEPKIIDQEKYNVHLAAISSSHQRICKQCRLYKAGVNYQLQKKSKPC